MASTFYHKSHLDCKTSPWQIYFRKVEIRRKAAVIGAIYNSPLSINNVAQGINSFYPVFLEPAPAFGA